MSAGQFCSRIIATASPDESVGTAARRMAEYDVGTLVVVQENRGVHAVGLVTDRDIAMHCIAHHRDADDTLVSDIMTTPVHSVRDDTPVEAALETMAEVGTRRLVVTGEGDRVAGILTLDDVLDLLARETAAIKRLLGKQQPRVPA